LTARCAFLDSASRPLRNAGCRATVRSFATKRLLPPALQSGDTPSNRAVVWARRWRHCPRRRPLAGEQGKMAGCGIRAAQTQHGISMKHYDYIVIGGGSGGIASANRAAMHGRHCRRR
jgi:hypothetical protein